MKELYIGTNEAGQRLDKLLGKVLNLAPSGFLYKMLRKKNIKLNEKRAEGKEILAVGDRVQLYLSDATYAKFHTEKALDGKQKADGIYSGTKQRELQLREIIYEDKNILILNKPAGVLSQKAKPEDDSLNEQLLRYLLEQGRLTKEQLTTFTPSVCNRLDRNTSGLVLAGVSLEGSRELSRMLRDRSLEKYYLTLVSGRLEKPIEETAYLKKDEKTNRVRILKQSAPGAKEIKARYVPIRWNQDYTLLEVKLITGKTHQIRASLAELGHPVLGDAKYGDRDTNRKFREAFGIQNQFLHAYRIVFPQMRGTLEKLSGREYVAPLPEKYNRAVKEIWAIDMNQEAGEKIRS